MDYEAASSCAPRAAFQADARPCPQRAEHTEVMNLDAAVAPHHPLHVWRGVHRQPHGTLQLNFAKLTAGPILSLASSRKLSA